MTEDQCNMLGAVTEQIDRDPEVALDKLKVIFDREGPYHTAWRFGALVNNSGEEFAIAFMSFWNNTRYPAY